jgi:hypothetical protein
MELISASEANKLVIVSKLPLTDEVKWCMKQIKNAAKAGKKSVQFAAPETGADETSDTTIEVLQKLGYDLEWCEDEQGEYLRRISW